MNPVVGNPVVHDRAATRGSQIASSYRTAKRRHLRAEVFAALAVFCVGLAAMGLWILINPYEGRRPDPKKTPQSVGSQPVAAVTSSVPNRPRQFIPPQPAPRSNALASPERVTTEPPANFSFDKPPAPAEPMELTRAVENWVARQTNDETLFDSKVKPNLEQPLDKLVADEWAKRGVTPAGLCSDEVFLRRVYIDILGTLPTVDEARAFLDSREPGKRSVLVDALLERPEFADYAAMKWSDLLRVKAEFPVNLWPNAAQAYHRWLRSSIRENLHYDEFARQLLTSSGSNFRAPPVNFYRAVPNKEAKGIAQAVALTFLGERADKWPPERLDGMAKFFSQVGYKPTGEWKEEIVYFDRRKGKPPGSTDPIAAIFPNGETATIPHGKDPRQVFADWLIADQNPWFARVACNRVWCWLFGRGIVDPPDDVRHDNPAANPALLKYLAQELVAAQYDMKQLYRLILNSNTYQLACIPHSPASPTSAGSEGAEVFAFYSARRLDAEVLIDAICQITGTTETYSSIIPEPFTFLPDHQRAIALPDGSITTSFLEMFGRPPRDTGLESERNNRLTAAQALHLLNSNHLRNKLKSGPGMRQLIGKAGSGAETAEILYLAILSRRPTENERSIVETPCASDEGARDVAWALINSDEFLFRH